MDWLSTTRLPQNPEEVHGQNPEFGNGMHTLLSNKVKSHLRYLGLILARYSNILRLVLGLFLENHYDTTLSTDEEDET